LTMNADTQILFSISKYLTNNYPSKSLGTDHTRDGLWRLV